jgi:Na+-transporting NADH:ubiquinone oxidoreductase subunit NqrB
MRTDRSSKNTSSLKGALFVNNPFEIRKVVGGVILTMVWICTFLFIKPTLVIDWLGDGSVTTNFKMVVVLIGLIVIFFYHLLVRSNPETTKLSWTSVLTISWLALIIFYPFKDPTNTAAGAIGFFTLLGGLLVCVLWVRFFSDEIVA